MGKRIKNRRKLNNLIRIAITGHRFWGNPKKERIKLFDNMDFFVSLLLKFGYKREDIVLLSGCATGVDLWYGCYAMERNFRLELYLPFKRTTQIIKGKMNAQQRKSLNRQYKYAEKVIVVNETYHTVGYQKRNVALVDNSQILLSYYTRSRSGSGNCVRYAMKKNKRIINLRNLTETFDATVHDVAVLLE